MSLAAKKFAFFGTPEFAAIILKKLIDAGAAPDLIICNPDRPIGRKKIITPPPTKIVAQKNGIKLWQPEKLDPGSNEAGFRGLDFAVVAAYAKIIPAAVLKLFPRGIIGVHPSLLPKYRGSSPIQTAILNGEKNTGVTLYLLDEKIDHGPILARQELGFPIFGFQFPDLLKELAALGGDLLLKTLPDFLAEKITPRPQEESFATYTKKFTGEDAFVRPDDLLTALRGEKPDKAAKIEREIRALNPEPGVWTLIKTAARAGNFSVNQESAGKRIKLLEAEIRDGRLIMNKIQIEGERPRKI